MTDIRERINRLPYPVARPCAVAFGLSGQHSLQTRLWNISFAGHQIIRLTLLPVIMDYLENPLPTSKMPDSKAAARIARHLSILHCPYYSTWIALLHTLATDLTRAKTGLEPALPINKVVNYLDTYTLCKTFSPRYSSGEEELPAHQALLALRNGIIQSGGLRDDATCKALIHHYLPVLQQLISAFDFLADCTLIAREPNGLWQGYVQILTGPEVPEQRKLDESIITDLWQTTLAQSSVVMSLPDKRTIGLSPLFSLGSTTPLALTDHVHLPETVGTGIERRSVRKQHICLLGIPYHQWPDPEALEELGQLLALRRAADTGDEIELAPRSIAEILRHRTLTSIQDLTGWVYFPDCQVERDELNQEWLRFMHPEKEQTGKRSPLQRNGLLLIGQAGSGKTSWVTHKAVKLLASNDPVTLTNSNKGDNGNLVLFLQGDMISTDEERPLLKTIQRSMGLRARSFASFDSLLAHIGLSWKPNRASDSRMIIFIDAVDEAPYALETMHEALQLVQAAARHSWCRIIVTLRTEFYKILKEKNADWNPDWGTLFELPLFTETEAGIAYNLYRAEGFIHFPGCQTPWQDLEPNTRKLLNLPLNIHLYHRTFSNREGEPTWQKIHLLRCYVDKLFTSHPKLEESCLQAAELILEKKNSVLNHLDADELKCTHLLELAKAKGVSKVGGGLSPIETMLEAGLMRWRTGPEGPGYLFTFDTVLEYLICRIWENNDPRLPLLLLQGIISHAPDRHDRFPQYWFAFDHLFARLLEIQSYDMWAKLLTIHKSPELLIAADNAWLEAAFNTGQHTLSSPAAFETTPPGQVLATYTEQKKINLLKRIYRVIKPFNHLSWQILILHALHKIFRDQLTAKSDLEILAEDNRLCATLAMLENRLGTSQVAAGRSADGLATLYRGRSLANDLVKAGHGKYLNDLAAIENNIAATLRQLGDLAEALEICQMSLERRYRCVIDENQWEYASDLANTNINLGNIHYQMNNLIDAKSAYQRARDIFAQLLTDEGRWSIAYDLAVTDANIAGVKRNQGDRQGAIDSYYNSAELRTCLVLENEQWKSFAPLCVTMRNLFETIGKQGEEPLCSDLIEKTNQLASKFFAEKLTPAINSGSLENLAGQISELASLLEIVGKAGFCPVDRRGPFRNMLAKLDATGCRSGAQSAPVRARRSR